MYVSHKTRRCALIGAWIDGVCEQLGEQIAVVSSEVDGKAREALKAFTNWNIEVFDEAKQARNKFYDNEEAISWRRFTQKDFDEEWCSTTSEMEKKL